MVVRDVRYQVSKRGFRTRQITLVPTRFEAEVCSMESLAEFYRKRLAVETYLGQLKTTMKMDVLHCKTVRAASIFDPINPWSLTECHVRFSPTDSEIF
jgi:Transposase DDE domain